MGGALQQGEASHSEIARVQNVINQGMPNPSSLFGFLSRFLITQKGQPGCFVEHLALHESTACDSTSRLR